MIETQQLPAHRVAIAALRRQAQETCDGEKAQQSEKFALVDACQHCILGFDWKARKAIGQAVGSHGFVEFGQSHTQSIGGRRHEAAHRLINEMDHPGLPCAGRVTGGNDTCGDGLQIGCLRSLQVRKARFVFNRRGGGLGGAGQQRPLKG